MPPNKIIEGKTYPWAETQGKSSGRAMKATMKKLDEECRLFQNMSKDGVHEAGLDSAAFGLNRLEYQAAKVVAIATVKEAYAQGQIDADDILTQVHKSTRKVAKDQAFQDWVKEASGMPGKMEQLGKLSPEEVKAEFVKSLSKDMAKENDGPKKEAPKAENKKSEKKKADPKLKSPAKEELIIS